jgi:hypothetical protein
VRQNGYTTACIGKWHLGMDWIAKAGVARPLGDSARTADPWSIDYAKPISNGPNAVGCDYFYGIAGSLDMPPFAFIENHHVTELPTVEKGWGDRKGPAAPEFEAVDVVPTLVRQAVGYLDAHAQSGEPSRRRLPRLGVRVYEVPVSYHGRTYQEGKKIGWRDAVQALLCIAWYGVFASGRRGKLALQTPPALDRSVSRATGKAAFVEPDLTSTTYPPQPRAH